MQKRAAPPVGQTEPEDAAAWRESLTYRVRLGLIPVAVMGLVATVTMSSAPGAGTLAAVVSAPIALLALDLVAPWLTQKSRAWLILVVLLVSGLVGLLRLGLFAGPALVFTTGVVLAGLLLGRRAMYAVLACAVSETAVVAAGMVMGRVPLPAATDVAFTSAQTWIRAGFIAALAWWLIGAAVLYMVSALEGANRHLREEQSLRTKADHERRVAEEAAVQAQKLDAVGRLAAGVAHDFNNALMIIQMWNEIGRAPRASVADRADAAEAITQASQRASVLARQLLILGRNEARSPRAFALAPFAREMQKTLARVLPADIVLSLEEEGAPHIVADETQLQQIVVNLVVNARDALPAGGLVVLRTGRLRQDAPHVVTGVTLPPGDWAFLEVEDSGTGMDAYVRAHALDAFFTTKERGKGTGLGLSTVRSITEQSGGGVELVSEVGKGTRVRVWLPNVEPEQHVSLAHVAPVTTDLRGRTLLVAEDNDEGRRLLERVLLEAGAKVHSARDVDGALELLERHGAELDALITDAVMPGRTVRALLERFAALCPNAPILVCSGYVGEELTRRGIGTGSLQLLPKPFTPPELLRAVGSLLAKDPSP